MLRRSGDAIDPVIALRLTRLGAAWHVLAAPQQRRVEPGRVAYGHCRDDPSRTGGGSSSPSLRSRSSKCDRGPPARGRPPVGAGGGFWDRIGQVRSRSDGPRPRRWGESVPV